MVFRNELSVLGFGAETTEGTAVTLVASKFAVRGAAFKEGIEMHQRATRRQSFSKFQSVPGSRMGTLTFEVDLYGQPTDGTAPDWAHLLRSCGLAATTAATNKTVYTVSSSGTFATIPSLTMGLYVDGSLRKIAGARGNATIKGKAGKPLMAAFEFRGVLADYSDTAILTPAYEANFNTPPILAGASFSLGGLSTTEAVVDTFEIALNNVLTMRSDANSAAGYLSCAITDRNPTFNVDPEVVAASAHDFFDVWRDQTTGALALTVSESGDTANVIAISAPAVQYEDSTWGDRGGISIRQMQCALRGSSSAGDDELVISLGT